MALHPFIVRRFSRLLNSRWTFEKRSGGQYTPHQLGEMGEKIAKAKLIVEGRKILYTNYRGSHGGEVDIVARHDDVLTFVEVKTRRQRETSRPLDAVDLKKQGYLRKAALSWIKLLKNKEIYWRFDVVEVELLEGELPNVTIVENVFPTQLD